VTELQKPVPNRLGRNLDAALCQQILNVAKRQRESGLEPDRMLDDLGREAMSLERPRDRLATVATPDTLGEAISVDEPAPFACQRPRT